MYESHVVAHFCAPIPRKLGNAMEHKLSERGQFAQIPKRCFRKLRAVSLKRTLDGEEQRAQEAALQAYLD